MTIGLATIEGGLDRNPLNAALRNEGYSELICSGVDGELVRPKGVFTSAALVDDRALINRIVAAYRYSCSGSDAPKALASSVWGVINGNKFASHEALMTGIGAEAILRCPSSNNLFYGFDSLVHDHIEMLRESAPHREAEASFIARTIECLAESVGAIRTHNPEASALFPKGVHDIDGLLSLISHQIGFEIVFPNPYRDEFGVYTKRGVASLRAIFALYQAHRLGQFKSISRKGVLEIGAGLGRTAFYAHSAGISDYTIVDLPLANAAQAYFLGRTIGPDNLKLAGEQSSAPVKILPPSALNTVTAGIVINADSLTEMDRSFADQYVAFARDNADVFISINHEVNGFTAADVIISEMPDVFCMRYPHPMRAGYVEEVAFMRRAAEA